MAIARPLAIAALAVAVSIAACGKPSPTDPTAVTPATTVPTSSTTTTTAPPTNTSANLTFALPLAQGDSANVAFGLLPFGYHAADHAEDGHPGFDVEYRAGGLVRAAAAGRVLSVMPDGFTAGRMVVQLEHNAGQHFYRTVYTNLASVDHDVAVGEAIEAGQVLGFPGTVSLIAGTIPVTFQMIHFQVDDFNFYAGSIPNPNAVSPEGVLNAEGRALFNLLWPSSVHSTEPVEPFATNPRLVRFPLTRVWRLESGTGPAGISFTRRDSRASLDYLFAILAESGVAVESGTVTLRTATRPLQTIDLVSGVGTRLGVWDIVDDRMRLVLGLPGQPRPADLTNAAVYRTSRL